MTMTQYMEELNRLLLQMATLSEEMVGRAVEALKNHDVLTARVVISKDREIDRLEVEIDRYILEMHARYQPVAVDLRLILSAQKINNDLERAADHAVSIAEGALALAGAPYAKPLVNIPRMADIARDMLRQAIDSFVYRDVALALSVKKRDDEIDALYQLVRQRLVEIVQADPANIGQALSLMAISIDLERIADLATNIAEEVVFITDAEIVKHQL